MQFLCDGPNLSRKTRKPRKTRRASQGDHAGTATSGLNIEQRTQELWAEHASAIDRRDPQGAIDALMAIAELHGLLGDRVEVAVVPGLREGEK
jgi:hypothetical protein